MLYDWKNAPSDVRHQINALITTIEASINENMLGVYLHGSLAMGSFNPRRSDLDLLVVTQQPLTLAIKRHLIAQLLTISNQPYPIEVSFLAYEHLHPWRFPTPFDLHYSEAWRTRYTSQPELSQAIHTDADLAAHITIVQARGIVLVGQPIATVFPSVPEADYLASLKIDLAESLAKIEHNPVYPILNCCRTSAYLAEDQILSKVEGGLWMQERLAGELQTTVVKALSAYTSNANPTFTPSELAAFADLMRRELKDIGHRA